jgi:hypothetical protein
MFFQKFRTAEIETTALILTSREDPRLGGVGSFQAFSCPVQAARVNRCLSWRAPGGSRRSFGTRGQGNRQTLSSPLLLRSQSSSFPNAGAARSAQENVAIGERKRPRAIERPARKSSRQSRYAKVSSQRAASSSAICSSYGLPLVPILVHI